MTKQIPPGREAVFLVRNETGTRDGQGYVSFSLRVVGLIHCEDVSRVATVSIVTS